MAAMGFYLRSLFVVIVFLTTYYQEVNAACYIDENGASCCNTETCCDSSGFCKTCGPIECRGGNGGGGSCRVTCKANSCEVRTGGTMGSCFLPPFPTECFGLPSGCGSCVNECSRRRKRRDAEFNYN